MRKVKSVNTLSTILAVLSLSQTSYSGNSGFMSLPSMIEKEWASHQILTATSISNSSAIISNQFSPNFQLNSFSDIESQMSLIKGHLARQGIHPLLNLVAKPSSAEDTSRTAFGLNQNTILSVKDFNFRVGKYDVCKSNLRTVSAPNGAVHLVGVAPIVDGVYQFSEDSWVAKEVAIEIAASELTQKGLAMDDLRVTSFSQCLFPLHGELLPVWKFNIRSGNHLYQMYVSQNDVIDGGELSFDVEAVVRAYDKGPADSVIKDFRINVTGDGTMKNDYFTTEDYTGAARMASSSHQFTGDPTSSTFAEQSAFAHVNRHLSYVLESGYSWQGPKPLTVKTHVKFGGGNINNAQYTPFDGSAGPFILIADGDGSVLQNLPYDSDVVSHEFGHHVVFGSITTTSGESLVLHEGLADAIAFLRTDDACLGESICPASSSLCQVRSKCLRTGDNSLKYNDDTYSRLGKAHLQGQLVSGFFWDLKMSGAIPSADLSKLLIGMIPYLPSDATLKSMLVALLDADFTLYNKQYQSIIVAAATERGMELTSMGISLGEIDGKSNTPSSSSPAAKKKEAGLLGGMCSIGLHATGASSAVWVGVIMLLPVLVQIIRNRPILVKIKKK